MSTFNLAPDPLQSTFFIPGGAVPGNGVQLFLYAAGSSTKQTAYKDNAGATPWSNPIVLDSGGNLASGGVIWFTAGQTYKAVYAPSNDTDPPASPYRTIDNLSGINDITSAVTEWIAGPTPTFVSGSQFTLSGDQTANFTKSRRLKFTVTAGTVFGAISSVSFAANTTTVNVAFASGALDSGLSAVSYSIIDPSNPSVDAEYADKQASSVASAGNGTTNIWGVAGNSLHITGTNTINNFSTAPYAGAIRELIFDGALILSSTSAIRMVGGANITTAANDRARVYADTTTSAVVQFYSADSGIPAVPPQTSGRVFAGPTSGASTAPAFRALVPTDYALSTMTNSLVGDVSLSTAAAYFDGPSVAQGTTGIWLATGQVTCTDSGGAAQFVGKLYDGSTTAAQGVNSSPVANFGAIVALSGIFINPAGNIRIAVADVSASTGTMRNALSGTKNSTITVTRIG